MIGIADRDYVALRFEAFLDEVVAPAAVLARAPLGIEVWQSPEAVPHAAAAAADFAPCAPGDRWGPAWSTAWFRLRGAVPAAMAGHPVALRFGTGTEALLWRDGAPFHGLDEHHGRALLLPRAAGGEDLELLVEAACNLPLGVSTFWWDQPETVRRWQEERPGRVEAAELLALDPAMEAAKARLDLALRTLRALPPEDPRGLELLHGLRRLLAEVPAHEPRRLLALLPGLDALLRGAPEAPRSVCHAVGHAHVDTAWLWPMRETRRKLLRTWATALALMDRFPRFRFLASSAQHYAWVEEDAPELFARVRQRVAEGRWEVTGGSWIENDCHAVSGESLVRQLVHGQRWFADRFGEDAPQRVMYLPDTFGFPASLPQIARGAGLDTFVTNKLSWCHRNPFPFTSFRWRGIDGTELLSHFTPGDDYNAPLEPKDLLHGDAKLRATDHGAFRAPRGGEPPRWLQPYGWGDGGGGPTEEMARRAELAAHVQGLPAVVQTGAAEFAAALHADRAGRLARGEEDLPAWDGELYLEFHTGTLTSQTRLKAANARAEARLRRIEGMLATLGDTALAAATAAERDAAWRLVLLHQFHDVLPGTSITEVHEEAHAAHEGLAGELDALEARVEAALRARLDDTGMAEPVLVFRDSDEAAGQVLEGAGGLRWTRPLPPMSAALFDLAEPGPVPAPVRATARRLENDHLVVELDEAGRVARLAHRDAAVPVNARGADGALQPLNQLVAHEDRPRRWEAWDLDFDLGDHTELLDGPADSIELVEDDPVRSTLEVRRRWRASEIVLRYSLEAGADRVTIDHEIDWREERTLLRALHPTAVRARSARFGIPFGHLDRPTHRNTGREQAAYEVPGQRWMELTQPGLGLRVEDDGSKFGRSVEGGVLGLSLLRAPNFPDPTADRGRHRFRTALRPLAGPAPEAAEAPALGPAARLLCPFRLSPGVSVAAFKPSEDGARWILRLVERRGGLTPLELRWTEPPAAVEVVDLLERPAAREAVDGRPLDHDLTTGVTTALMRPFEILTLAFDRRG
jgi:alpha-mannosidase